MTDIFSSIGTPKNNGDKAIEAILRIKDTIETYRSEEITITKQHFTRVVTDSIADAQEQLKIIWESQYHLEA